MSKINDIGDKLGIIGNTVLFLSGIALMKAVKNLINNPDDISKQQSIYNTEISQIANDYKKDSEKWADTDLISAYLLGIAFANSQVSKLKDNKTATNTIIGGTFLFKNIPTIFPTLTNNIVSQFKNYPQHLSIVELIRSQSYSYTSKQAFQILRAANDEFRKVSILVGSKAFKESNYFTRLNLSQQLLNEYSRRGLKTITYKNGAVHNIENYSEMLGRNMTNNAFRQANLNRYMEYGYELGQVSSHFRACPFCVPYEGEILSLDGKSKQYPSLYAAITGGLFHVNCLHSISPYTEGESILRQVSIDPAEQSLINQYGYREAQEMSYNAQQQQRYNERQIRKYKRLESTSLDNKTKSKYKSKISEWQSKQRELINNNTYLKRKYSREQINKAH